VLLNHLLQSPRGMDFLPQGFIKHGSEAYVTKALGAGSLEVGPGSLEVGPGSLEMGPLFG
jgi:hypothetical protein